MSKLNFSIVMIAKNEEAVLPRLLSSLEEFKSKGGEVCLLDTGSVDKTAQIAKDWGCKVEEVGTKFIKTINAETADAINKMFIVEGEENVVKDGDRFFDFSEARNHAAAMASNNMVSFADADEIFTKLDLDKIEKLIDDGFEQFEYNFVFAHDIYGKEAIKFIQSKMYDKRKMKWTNMVHEVLQGDAKRMFLDESIFKLEHFQIPSEHRGNYLPGLALDCYLHQDYDRNSHYFARELCWHGRPKSAIKEFERHIAMDKWPAERAQSMIFIGDCYGMLNKSELQVEWYNKAIYIDNTRREALIKLARFYKHNNNPQMTAVYATACMEIPWSPFYANDVGFYTHEPHELLYWAKGWMGDIPAAQHHILKALEYQPMNPAYLRDTKYYFEYGDAGVTGWMKYPELVFLYESAKKMRTVAEVGSWKGRSTHAICSGCKGTVTAIDHFLGSKFEPGAHREAQGDAVFNQFKDNTKDFLHLNINRKDSLEAAKDYPDKSFDMIFIDAGHTYEEVKEDLRAWKDKARVLLCGHDYDEIIWPGVKQAVDEEMVIDGVVSTVWYKWIQKPKVSIVIPTLGRPDKLRRLLETIKENAGYDNYEVIVENDSFENRQGAPKTLKKGVEKSTGELVMFLGNDCIPQKDFLLNAVVRMAVEFPELDGLIGLNDTYWNGEFATHWLASKKLLPYLDGEFFHTGYHHIGCDNELTERCRKIGKYVWEKEARVVHDHPILTGFKPGSIDKVYELAYNNQSMEEDMALLKKRSEELGFIFNTGLSRPIIPKKISSIWLNDKEELPPLIKKCLMSQRIKDYDYELITLKNCPRDIPYVNAAIAAKRWVKAADYLRLYYLYKNGGIYLDADTEVLTDKDFDDLLTNRMFVCREDNGFIANGIVGSEPQHPVLKMCLDEMDKLDGADDKVFEYGMEIFTKKVYEHQDMGIKICGPEYFLPYNHQTGITNMTPNTKTYHHYLKSWKEETPLEK